MRKRVLIFLLLLVPAISFSQKLPVHVVRKEKDCQWQILDNVMGTVFPGSDVFDDDSLTFTLETDRRYFFSISINRNYSAEETLFILYIGDEPVIRVTGETDAGDHFLPFYTGVRAIEKKIFGGSDALLSEFPWQIYLVSGNFSCGGSIIANNWILTAGHCVTDDNGSLIPASKITVRAGANNPFDPSQGTVYNASDVIRHESYNDNTLENDIALIKLSSPITNPNASVVHLVTQQDVNYGAIDPGVMAWVTGWGLTRKNPSVYPSSLQKVQLPIISTSQASTVWKSIPPTDLMAGFLNGNKDACNGDSGGPLVVPVLGEYRQAGLVSWGSSECNTYGAYTNVSMFLNWIRIHTGIQPVFVPPSPRGDTVICTGTPTDQYSVEAVPGADTFEWRIFPYEAGNISGNVTSATVTWSSGFTGIADLGYRITRSGQLSDWSRIRVRVVQLTRITKASQDTALCANQPVNLNVNTEGYNLRYQWYRNGTAVQGATGAALTFSSSIPANSGNYFVEVQGQCGAVRSASIQLTVYALTDIKSVSPEADIPFGSDKEIQVSSAGHDLKFQWQKDSVSVSNGNDSILLLQNVTANDIGLYRVIVTGTCGTKTSGNIYIFVTGDVRSGAPEILLWPSITNSAFNIAESEGVFYNIQIYNEEGKLVMSKHNLQYQNEIDISHLHKGIYFVNVYSSSFRKTIKLIKT